jgi:hypothetical protein
MPYIRLLALACIILAFTACTARFDTDFEPPEDVQSAIDTALAYVRETTPDQAPPADLEWAGQNITPEDLVGAVTFRFRAPDWDMTVTHPVAAPEDMIYRIFIENTATGFKWSGTVNAVGEVDETATTEDNVAPGEQ